MDAYFTDLGREVSRRWKEANFSPYLFPSIACEVLVESPPAQHVDVPSLIREFLLEDAQPFQTQSNFGQPELIAYDEPRFYIQILFWLEGTTEIHQHEFSGAFHVMEGSSLHSEFAFENSQSVSAHLKVGDLALKETLLLETGSTVPIVAGRSHIHSLFHLDTPSISVVVRTHNDPGTGPQFSYLPPHLAIDPVANDALSARRRQLLDVLEKIDDPTYPEIVREMVEALDFERGFYILQHATEYLKGLGVWDEIWAVFAEKHGELADFIVPTLEEIVWRDNCIGLRGTITDSEHRFFLALLLNVPTRDAILAIVAQRYDGPATKTILRWVEELSESTEAGAWILDAQFPLDLPAEDQLEVFLGALGNLLHDEVATTDGTLTDDELAVVKDVLSLSSLRALVTKA